MMTKNSNRQNVMYWKNYNIDEAFGLIFIKYEILSILYGLEKLFHLTFIWYLRV